MLAENYAQVKKTVEEAAVRSGRQPSDVTLISVGKMHPAEAIKEVYDAGSRDFGENKVQELTEKN